MPDIDIAALSVWLASVRPDLRGPVSLAKFPGGQSNPTYRLEVGERQLVLRRKPSGKLLPSAHAIDREYRLIAALDPIGFPVPAPLALCMDESVIGAAFYVMELVDGRIFWDGSLPDRSPAERSALYHAMVDTLAGLHAIDPASVGLADYGRPGNYVERQVGRWTAQYRASQTDEVREIELLIDYLAASIPPQGGTAIIHGDYRIDNLVFDPVEPRVIAVLDWELSTLGDPVADFAYFAMHWVMPTDGRSGLGGVALEAAGLPTLAEIVTRYCRATGRASLPDLRWYFAYNLFRLVAILQGVKRRMIDGNASSANAAISAARIAPLAAVAWQQAQLAGAAPGIDIGGRSGSQPGAGT